MCDRGANVNECFERQHVESNTVRLVKTDETVTPVYGRSEDVE